MRFLLLCLTALLALLTHLSAETLPALKDGKVPQNLDELWAGFDPRKEPLEVEVTKEWEQDGIVCRVIRYRIGTFKGKPATMAAFYAFPKGAQNLPAILQIHGGGQSASLAAVTTNAKLGYASVSLNWGGNKMTFADGKIYDGLNTDWGVLDATHPPQRNKTNHFAGGTAPDEFTLDAIDSPRNDNWFLVALSARRALTFLEQQPEVDPAKLGVTGHSMGGRLTTMVTGIDARVKAAVPSCGGSGDFTGDPALTPGVQTSKRSARDLATISENKYIERLKVPTLWFSPTNDFHAHIDNFAYTWRDVPDRILGLAISPHFNHRHSDDLNLTATLWFEQHLKGKFTLPQTPGIQLTTPTAKGEATLTVTPDESRAVKSMHIYVSADPHALTRFWRTVPAIKSGAKWIATVATLEAQDPLFAFVNVTYEAPMEYRKTPTTPGVGPSDVFTLSSRMLVTTGAQLAAQGVRPTAPRNRMIDTGANGWQDWFRLNWGNPNHWLATTRKVKDPLWRGPQGARLAFEINPANDAFLYVTVTRNAWGAFGAGSGEYVAAKPIKASGGWMTLTFSLEDFQPVDPKGAQPLKDWSTLTDLSISGHATVVKDGAKVALPSNAWKNAGNLDVRQLRWVGGEYQGSAPTAPEMTEAERTKAFNDSIKASIEQEKRDRETK